MSLDLEYRSSGFAANAAMLAADPDSVSGLDIIRVLIVIKCNERLLAHWISVRRMCQGGKPWSSSGVRLYCKGLMGCIIIKSGDDNSLSFIIVSARGTE